ncbi:MAG: CHAT domain-containing protein [Planctomycetota bacterium]
MAGLRAGPANAADAPAAPAAPAGPQRALDASVREVRAAFVAHDAAALERAAAMPGVDPYLVAGSLWRLREEATDAAVRAELEGAARAWASTWAKRPGGEGIGAWLDRAFAAPAAERADEWALLAVATRLRNATDGGAGAAVPPLVEEARERAARVPWGLYAAGALVEVARTYLLSGAAGAEAAWAKAREAATRIGWDDGVLFAERFYGAYLHDRGRHAEALETARRTEALAARRGNRGTVAVMVANAATELFAMGRFAEAKAEADRAVEAASGSGSKMATYLALDVLASSLAALGDRPGAKSASARAAEAAIASGGGLEILFRRALLLRENDAWGESMDAFEDFLVRAERASDTSGLFLAHRELSTLHRALGQPEKALDHAQRALEIAVKTGEPVVIGDARTSVAISRLLVERRRGPVAPDAPWLREATEEARRAAAGYVAASMERGADGVRLALARLQVARDDHVGAIETLRGLATRPGVDVERSEVGVLLRAVEAEVDAAAGRWRKAAEAARRSLEIRRGLARGLGESDAIGSREDAEATAALGVTACAAWAAAAPAEAVEAAAVAFGCVEDSRGVLLAEGLTNRSALLWRDADPKLVERDHATRAAVAAARARLLDAKGDDAASAQAALDAAWKEREDAVARLQRAAARTAAFVDPPRPDAKATAGCLTPQDAVVVYRTTGGAAGHAVVVRHDGPRLVGLGPLAALDAAIKAWRRVVATDGGDDRRAAAKAYDVLVRPLDAALAGASRLVFVPDGALSFLPFEALLRVDGARSERLVERAEVTYVPSAGLLDVLGTEAASQAAGTDVLALGDPTLPSGTGFPALPGGGEEARSLANRFAPGHATLLVGERAGAEALLEALAGDERRFRVVHLACHGLVDPDRPSGSGLLLAGGKVLDVDRIERERWRADLVVLSACESGRGRVVLGEGVFGLVRAALLAGVPRVVTSQWVVSDRATRRFMDRFYDAHLGRGLSAASALTDAKRAALAAGGEDASPSRWAAFVLWGAP